MINNQTRLNLIIGYPLAHSKSPVLHNAVYKELNCNAVMLAHATETLSETINSLKTLDVGLTAVTMPYKKEILPYLDNMSDEVKTLGAANTIICHQNKLTGYNTDVDGIAYALRDVTLANKTVLVIGAGGAANAAAYYLAKQNANILWLNRTQQHAVSIMQTFGGKCVDANHLNELQIDVIINTTPLGMYPDVEVSPLPNYKFNHHQIIFDMVYNPVQTLLIKQAKKAGATCISGLDMFIGQGLRQIELWLNQSIDKLKLTDMIKIKLKENEVTA